MSTPPMSTPTDPPNTRTQLLQSLRAQPRTVNDLAAELSLTDNAVRAHLADLQSQELVIQSGERPGTRKPHALFALTPRGHEFLSHLYAPVLNTLLDELRLPAEQTCALFQSIGHRLAQPHLPTFAALPPADRPAAALDLLRHLGANAELDSSGDTPLIRGKGCPLASTIPNHPHACTLVETLLSDLLQQPVQEYCQKSPNPQCRFAISPAPPNGIGE